MTMTHPDPHPPYLYEGYRSSVLRAPKQQLIMPKFGPDSIELTAPVFGHQELHPLDGDLTRRHAGEPIGERIIVTGRVLDGDGRPVRGALLEVWQANAAGRYVHAGDQHPAPLDPNFTGAGRVLTDAEGRYRFTTIKPGAYPWRNHHNAWRPAHIHFSVFGTAFTQRLVTQMYFPGDPLFAYDPIMQSIPDQKDRDRLVSRFDLDTTEPEWALGYQWDIVLGKTPMED
jgi:protocatechuate 3,4-dioxygenase beta subunit